MKRWQKVLMAYLISAPIPPVIVGALGVGYENISFWLAQIYGLPFWLSAELTGSYGLGLTVYVLVVGASLGLWIAYRSRRQAEPRR
jgi:hypothetical protein